MTGSSDSVAEVEVHRVGQSGFGSGSDFDLVDFFNQHDERVAEADSWCFRTERLTASQEGTKYNEVKARGEKVYTEEELEAIYRHYAEEEVRDLVASGAETTGLGSRPSSRK